uniref:Uncharacterized protein n=1 Tax=Geospiza parvula TaxID=87175 RepID=A0A8U8AI68_GEOPR
IALLLFSQLHYEAFVMLVIIQRCSCCSQTHAAQPYNALYSAPLLSWDPSHFALTFSRWHVGFGLSSWLLQ